jgi:hypothetical protein
MTFKLRISLFVILTAYGILCNDSFDADYFEGPTPQVPSSTTSQTQEKGDSSTQTQILSTATQEPAISKTHSENGSTSLISSKVLLILATVHTIKTFIL